MQLNLLANRPEWLPPTTFPRVKGLVGFDWETKDPFLQSLGPGWAWSSGMGDEKFGYPIGAAVSWIGDQGTILGDYWPFAHLNGGNLPARAVLGWVKDLAEDPDVHLVMANSPYDLGWLQRLGIKVANPVHDVQLQAPLLDEHRFSYSLDSLLKDKLGEEKLTGGVKQALRDHGLKGMGDMWRLPSPFVGPYATQDAVGTLKLFLHQQKEVEEQGLQEAYDVERKLTRLVVDMRFRGVRVNEARAMRLREHCLRREAEVAAELKRITGLRLDPFDAALGQILKDRGLPVVTLKTKKISVTKDVLASSKDEVAILVREGRRWNKCRTTFVEGHILGHAINGRVHCQFHQLRSEDDEGNGHGAITQRFSSSDPNLQQLVNPERDLEVGVEVRGCFGAEDGEEWGVADYKSQEPRLITHFAAMTERAFISAGKHSPITGALAFADKWNADPDMDPYLPTAEAAGIKRKPAKTIYLGIAYGMGNGKLCRSLGFSTEPAYFDKQLPSGRTQRIEYEKAGPEGQHVMDVFDQNAPYLRQLAKMAKERAETKGYVIGLDGARFRAKDESEHHKMVNKLAQGSAGRQNKRALLAAYEAGLGQHILVTVHDEIGASLPGGANGRVAQELIQCMVESTRLLVPSRVDLQCGVDWGEASRPT